MAPRDAINRRYIEKHETRNLEEDPRKGPNRIIWKNLEPKLTSVGNKGRENIGDLSSLMVGRKTLMGDSRQTRT